ncbi:hypothetical protein ACFQY0_02200 [Haloferula chungangensis]|uniref:TIGR02588 family protein n=1 Tax=Haloferula chungangensis TaxID=1048331 RepID=A0ABW2L4A5_9BACT
MKNEAPEASAEETIPAAEWTVAAIGLVLLCLCVAFLVYKAFFVDDGVPEIAFEVERIVPQDEGALVLANVSNSGGQTVTELQIVGSSQLERHEVKVDFLPARSTRSFGMFFSHVPDKASLNFVPGGYQEP